MTRRNGSSVVPRLWAVRALAEATTVPASSWYTLIARGEIPVVRIGRSVRVREEDFVAWLERHRERGAP